MYMGKWALLLAIFWLLLSGFLKTLLLIFGIISVLLVIIVIKRMDAMDQEPLAFDFGPKMLGYIGWLTSEITKSSFEVSKLVWGSPKKVSPSIAQLDVSDLPEDKRVLYTNSITLTPGTLSVDLDKEQVTVHALHEDSIQSLQEGSMSSQFKNTWGSQHS